MDDLPFSLRLGNVEYPGRAGRPSGALPHLRRKVAGLDAGPRAGENRRALDHFTPKVFALAAGPHTLIVTGREGNVLMPGPPRLKG